ncbi:MAG: hypothetical protein WC722_10575, partial [Rhodospirillales bacterium]
VTTVSGGTNGAASVSGQGDVLLLNDSTHDTIAIDFVSGTVDNSFSGIEKISLNQDKAYELTLSRDMMLTTDYDGNPMTEDYTQVVNAATALTQGVTIDAADYVGVGDHLIVDGANFGGDDSVLGGSGADTISTGAGSDTIRGGAGADSLYGGLGSDKFIFDVTQDAGVKVIGDLGIGDLIDLDFAVTSIINGPGTPVDGYGVEVSYDSNSGDTTLYFNSQSGQGPADYTVTLADVNLDATDFTLAGGNLLVSSANGYQAGDNTITLGSTPSSNTATLTGDNDIVLFNVGGGANNTLTLDGLSGVGDVINMSDTSWQYYSDKLYLYENGGINYLNLVGVDYVYATGNIDVLTLVSVTADDATGDTHIDLGAGNDSLTINSLGVTGQTYFAVDGGTGVNSMTIGNSGATASTIGIGNITDIDSLTLQSTAGITLSISGNALIQPIDVIAGAGAADAIVGATDDAYQIDLTSSALSGIEWLEGIIKMTSDQFQSSGVSTLAGVFSVTWSDGNTLDLASYTTSGVTGWAFSLGAAAGNDEFDLSGLASGINVTFEGGTVDLDQNHSIGAATLGLYGTSSIDGEATTLDLGAHSLTMSNSSTLSFSLRATNDDILDTASDTIISDSAITLNGTLDLSFYNYGFTLTDSIVDYSTFENILQSTSNGISGNFDYVAGRDYGQIMGADPSYYVFDVSTAANEVDVYVWNVGSGANDVIGTTDADVLYTQADSSVFRPNIVYAQDGDDEIYVEHNNAMVFGGDGNDIIYVDTAAHLTGATGVRAIDGGNDWNTTDTLKFATGCFTSDTLDLTSFNGSKLENIEGLTLDSDVSGSLLALNADFLKALESSQDVSGHAVVTILGGDSQSHNNIVNLGGGGWEEIESGAAHYDSYVDYTASGYTIYEHTTGGNVDVAVAVNEGASLGIFNVTMNA